MAVKITIGKAGIPTATIEITRPIPPNKAVSQSPRKTKVCSSILGVIHSNMMPSPAPKPPKKRKLLSSVGSVGISASP